MPFSIKLLIQIISNKRNVNIPELISVKSDDFVIIDFEFDTAAHRPIKKIPVKLFLLQRVILVI